MSEFMNKEVINSEISYLKGFLSEASLHPPFNLPPISTLIGRVKRSLDTIKAALEAGDGQDN